MQLPKVERPSPAEIRNYYAREDVMDFIFRVARGREFVPVYDGKYGKRPDMLSMPGDLKTMILNGATSFHMSVERWHDPLKLSEGLKQDELSALRSGWDLILDIDCNEGYVYAKCAAEMLIRALRAHGIKNVFVKFSGSRGFHVAVPFESMPREVEGKPIEELYPELLQNIARYLKHLIKERLAEVLVRRHPEIYEKIVTDEGDMNPYNIMEIEENWSVRHLFRAPLSLNEKTWLVSLPISPEELPSFDPEMAKIENVKVRAGFLTSWKEGEAENLVYEALDFAGRYALQHTKPIAEEYGIARGFSEVSVEKYVKGRVDATFFPPCIKKGLQGLEDGRKRFLFILINFLKLMRWSPEEIERVVWEWNSRNKEPLRESYIRSQLKYAFKKPTAYIPPNCNNADYYPDLKICEKDSLCESIRNPLTYTLKRYALYLKQSGKGRRKMPARKRKGRTDKGDSAGANSSE